jgi:hypothetical protein
MLEFTEQGFVANPQLRIGPLSFRTRRTAAPGALERTIYVYNLVDAAVEIRQRRLCCPFTAGFFAIRVESGSTAEDVPTRLSVWAGRRHQSCIAAKLSIEVLNLADALIEALQRSLWCPFAAGVLTVGGESGSGSEDVFTRFPIWSRWRL